MATTKFRGVVQATGGMINDGDMSLRSVSTSITAAGSNSQTNATALTAFLNIVTTVSATTRAVKLPTAATGKMVAIHNTAATAVKVYPASGDAINAASVDAVGTQTIAQNKGNIYIAQNATTWRVIAGA